MRLIDADELKRELLEERKQLNQEDQLAFNRAIKILLRQPTIKVVTRFKKIHNDS